MTMLIISCSDTNDAIISNGPGGVTETTNGIAARIVLADGSPVDSAEVKLVFVDSLKEEVLKVPEEYISKVYSDLEGYIDIDSLPKGRVNLIVKKDDKMAVVFDIEKNSESPEIIVMSKKLLLSIKNDSVLTIVGMAISGTDIEATLNDEDYFEFELPAGLYGISTIDTNDIVRYLESSVDLKFNETKIEGYNAYERGFLVDDFSNNDMATTRIYEGLGYGNWYTSCRNSKECYSGPNDESDEYLYITYDEGTLNLGFSYWSMQGSSINLNLRSLEAVCFRAKGDSKITVSMISKDDNNEKNADFELVTLTQEWTEYCVEKISDVAAWEEISDVITNVEFNINDGTEASLDDVYFRGINLHELN